MELMYIHKDQLKHKLKDYLSIITEKSKGKDNYVCPLCKSGLKKHKTGALHYHEGNAPYVTCYSCRQIDGDDIFSLIGKLENIDSFTGQYRRACQIFVLDDDTVQDKSPKSHPVNLSPKDYWQKRGLSLKTANRFGVTWTDNYQFISAKGNAIDCGPSVIIPYDSKNTQYFIVRLIHAPDFLQTNYLKQSGNTGEPCFNSQVLSQESSSENIVFITESPFCAMSIMQESLYDAIALDGTGFQKLLTACEALEYKPAFIICLDNDKPGETAANNLLKSLKDLDYKAMIYNIAGEHKDPNEALVADSQAFRAAIEEAADAIKQDISFEDTLNLSGYLALTFNKDAEKFYQYSHLKTGFAPLDKKMGGLDVGLNILGGIPSVGKTTFALQLMYNLAARGEDTLYFSLEQSRFEIVSKLMSLYMFKMLKDSQEADNAYSARDIMLLQNHQIDQEIVSVLKKRLSEISDKIFIDENAQSIIDIKRTIKKILENRHPVIIIDYLQIIQTDGYKLKRDEINMIIHELKALSRQYHLIILVLSSLNRTSYTTQLDFNSYKESGDIEYGADCIFGLQYSISRADSFIKEKSDDVKRSRIIQEKKKYPRQIDFVCLKSRNGNSNFILPMNYYSKNNFFEMI